MKRIVSITSLGLIGALAISGCSLIKSGQNKNLTNSASQLNPEAFVGSAGIKNVNQLLQSMASVTNVPMGCLAGHCPSVSNSALQSEYSSQASEFSAINSQYQTVSPFISATGSVSAINPAMLLSITGLAGQFCQVFLQDEGVSLNVLAGTGVNLGSSGSTSQFSSGSAVTTAVINAMANQFWGRQPTSDELSDLTNAISGAVSSGISSTSGTSEIENVLIVPCTSMLSSPAFLLG